ncbi:hypothetical protein DEO23_07195 [Brachybacterium endophyticum]|uniref:Alpha/beta hydrolase n=1 Tax=Brachybacterium endophyticum TaxID=2182385 RepID=A0A2U2RLN1_9MICO|nr:WXG100 family type VII secretion target [Brachybacterium endophyticum]PWH06705.1 hypothetical protein DEO23_07195 [Brachybacterium endophyticum]
MNGFLGMDTAQVRQHALRLRAASARMDALRVGLDPAMAGLSWKGVDADAFRAAWAELSTGPLHSLPTDLVALGLSAERHAAEQDAASDVEWNGETRGGRSGGEEASRIPPAPSPERRRGYLREDDPFLADPFETRVEGILSHSAHRLSEAVGWGWDLGLDGLGVGIDALGRRSAAVDQLRADGDRLGGILEDWAAGERVPTYAELTASGLLTAGSAGVTAYEATGNRDTALLDDRPGGLVTGVLVDTEQHPGPRDLGDLIIGNDDLRMEGEGQGPTGSLATGRIGVQEVHSTAGGDPVYIVQVPPTEGAGIGEVPEAYGGQGNSRDWGSNLRLVAGQDPAAMDDVRAALTEAEVPAGAQVMLVGHSQGGIITSHLAADPGFNSTSGAAGTYDVTTSFSLGSPVQTVLPAQDSTEVVNVAHGPIGLDPAVTPGPDLRYTGDPVAELDLQGAQVGGGFLSAPNVHEVVLPGSTRRVSDGVPGVAANHDSYDERHPGDLYYGSVQRHAASDPVLSGLRGDLEGRYIGEGTYVARSTVVEVGRGAP